jgi:hypothetical protein
VDSRDQLGSVRKIVLALPEVSERISHGAVSFFVLNERALCYFHDNHRGDRRISLWCPARQGAQRELTRGDPERFFAPTTSARGTFANWVGIYLDSPKPEAADWREITAILRDAYRLAAPARLIARLPAAVEKPIPKY